MLSGEFVQLFPKAFLAETFDGHIKNLLEGGINDGHVINIRDRFARYIKFDQIVQEFKKQMEDCPDIELSEYQDGILRNSINRQSSMISWMNQVNFTNRNDVNSVFQTFINQTGGNFKNEIEDLILSLQSNLDNFKLQCKYQKIENNQLLLGDILKNKKEFEDAKAAAENWIKTKPKVTESAIQEFMNEFENKANNHRSAFLGNTQNNLFGLKPGWIRPVLHLGISWWLLGAAVGALVAAVISWLFILEIKTMPEVGIGAALIRISALVIPYSLTIFCTQQFLSHRKLFEEYKFKHIALGAMRWLIKNEFPESSDERSDIIKKATDIIFQEPYAKEDINSQKKFTNDLRDIVKERLSK